jgi:hypothetical protein
MRVLFFSVLLMACGEIEENEPPVIEGDRYFTAPFCLDSDGYYPPADLVSGQGYGCEPTRIELVSPCKGDEIYTFTTTPDTPYLNQFVYCEYDAQGRPTREVGLGFSAAYSGFGQWSTYLSSYNDERERQRPSFKDYLDYRWDYECVSQCYTDDLSRQDYRSCIADWQEDDLPWSLDRIDGCGVGVVYYLYDYDWYDDKVVRYLRNYHVGETVVDDMGNVVLEYGAINYDQPYGSGINLPVAFYKE